MEKLARFSDYDVFAYIASGFAALAVWDVAFSTTYVLGANWTAPTAVLTIFAAYVLGQILGSPSAWLIERNLVHRVLGNPTDLLLQNKPLKWRAFLKKTVLADYYTPLDSGLRQRIAARFNAEFDDKIEIGHLFWRAFSVAKHDTNAYGRMENFLKLYGFCRNMAFVGFIGAIFIVLSAILDWSENYWTSNIASQLKSAALALLVALGMMHRYLKFLRLYNVEVLLAYSESNATKRTSS